MGMNLNNLVVSIGHFKLGPLNFEFPETGICLVRGSNGSGKTTLFRSLMGRLRLGSGNLSGLKFPIGMIGVEPLLMGSWTVKENFKWFSKLAGHSHSDELYERCKPLFHQKASHLSTGLMRQVELSIILSLNFPTLFLDEALSPLDTKQRAFFFDKIREKAKSSLVLMTTHHEDELMHAPDKILELS